MNIPAASINGAFTGASDTLPRSILLHSEFGIAGQHLILLAP